MATASFEEKQYEYAANLEIAVGGLGGNQVRPAGQVLEGIVGYDAAAQIDPEHSIWKVLQMNRPPGTLLYPRLWAPGPQPRLGSLPPIRCHLVLQYKRPEYLAGHRAKQWAHWRRPYFRFAVEKGQQRVLENLERAAAGRLLVRYAAPAFTTVQALEVATALGIVLESSGFVAPSLLKGHRAWTYEAPGIAGYANPRGESFEFESADSLADQVRNLPSSDQLAIDVSVTRQMALALTYRSPRLRQIATRVGYAVRSLSLEISPERESELVAYITVQTILSRVGAQWLVLL